MTIKIQNYYDDKNLLKDSQDFIIESIRKQQSTIAGMEICFCLGEGTNYKLFQKLNEKHQFYKEIIPLPHPRWIMQYKRKKLAEYTNLYIEKLRQFNR